jgi:hypothetical protein
MTRYTYGQPGQVRQLANPYAHRGRAARLGGLDEQCSRPQRHYVVALLGALFGPDAAHAARAVGQHSGQRLSYYPCKDLLLGHNADWQPKDFWPIMLTKPLWSSLMGVGHLMRKQLGKTKALNSNSLDRNSIF